MIEQVKSLDWRARGASFIETAPSSVLHDVKLVLGAILDFQRRAGQALPGCFFAGSAP